MSKIVLDASALLALINQEKGAELVEEYLPSAMMSWVNVCETLTVLLGAGIPEKEAENIINELIDDIIPFEKEHAILTANLRTLTKPYGLSLGDRAALSLAKIERCPVLTADKIWSKLNSPIKIILIR